MWFIGVKEEQETSAPPPKKNPGSALDPGKLSNRPCLATVSLDCISNDFVSLSHYAPTSMAKQGSVICVNFFPFHHTYHSLLREDQ